MADSLDARHGTSDEYYDPYCDLCFKTKGHNVKAWGYCKDCFQFLCSDCNVFHSNLQAARGHIVLRGEDMPQSQATKPPRFEDCDVHPKHVQAQFCFEHQILLCSLCSSYNHKNCSVLSVDDACKNINTSDVDTLYDSINSFKTNLETAMSSADTNVKTLKTEQEKILKQAQMLYQKIISKAAKQLQELKNDIDSKYQSYLSVLSKQHKQLNDVVSRLDAALNDIAQEKGKRIDTKVFLRVHGALNYKELCKNDIQYLKSTIRNVSLSFTPSKEMQDFLSSSSGMGTISTAESKSDVSISILDIHFPASPPISPPANPVPTQLQSSRQSGSADKPRTAGGPREIPVATAKPRKLGTYQIKLDDDMEECWITGIAVTKDGTKLIVDYENRKVKMFSRDMKFLSSVSLSNKPWDVVMVDDQEAVVGTLGNQLVHIQIHGCKLVVKKTTELSFTPDGIAKYKDKFLVTTQHTTPPSVNLIDQAGRVHWSVATDKLGQPMFIAPWYVSSFDDKRTSSVIVTDMSMNTLTLLNGDKGEVITSRQLEGKLPTGIATDTVGNFGTSYN